MNGCLGSAAASVIFCECGIAGELAALTVVADLQMQLCSRAREGLPRQISRLSERDDCACVGGPVERETWWMRSEGV